MTKFHLIHSYDVDRDTWIQICFNPDPEDEENLLKLENVQEREEFERHEDDRRIRTKVRYFAVGMIPKPIRPYLKPHMLSWVEESVYDKQGCFWTWNIVPHFFSRHLTCRGKMSVAPDGENRCKRITDGYISINVPIVGELAERVIVEHLKKNMAQEYKMFLEVLRKRVKK